MRHSADQINAFQALGVGEVCYLLTLDYHAVKSLCGAGADIKPGETECALIDSDGSPRLIRGTAADCLLAAEEHGVVVASVH